MLEPCAVKVASTVLRRGDGYEAVFLSDIDLLIKIDILHHQLILSSRVISINPFKYLLFMSAS